MNTEEEYKLCLEYMFTKLPMYQRVGAAAYKKDLSNIIKLCDALGNPQNEFKSIHVAGTNGKGSVCHMLSAVFQEAGYKTGLYVSPHYKDFRERIKVDGTYVDQAFVVDFINNLKALIEEIQPSFFEINVAMAFEYFKRQKVDIAIIETGLGGRLDSTNIIHPILSVITNISYDHTQMLGDTLVKIAVEKAGIIKHNIPVVIGESQDETDHVFQDIAKQRNAPLSFATDYYNVRIDFKTLDYCSYVIKKQGFTYAGQLKFNIYGSFQTKNIATLLQTMDVYNQIMKFKEQTIYFKTIQKALSNLHELTKFQGRWQVINKKPLVICDSAHNESGILGVCEEIKEMDFNKLHFVYGAVNDKDLNTILSILPKYATYYFCKADVPRGLDSEELTEMAHSHGLVGKSYGSVNNAYKAALKQADTKDLVFIGGSIFVVAEIL